MTIDQLIRIASGEALKATEIEAAASDLRLSRNDVCDAFAKRVAQGYLDGEYSYTIGDTAMNNLFAFAYPVSGTGLPNLARQVYEAFDQGEYHHLGEAEELQGEVRTRSLLARIPQLRRDG
jgi:hypothetical protein